MARQNVIQKILADAKEETKEILDKYKNEISRIRNEFESRIATKKAQIKAEVEGVKKTETMREISQKRLEFNRKIVLQKRKFTKGVIDDALKKLTEHKEYLNFLKDLIRKSGEKEGELIINKYDWTRYGRDLENFMKNEGLNYKINMDKKILGGVMIKKDKMTYHGTLDLISELLSDELTIAVSKKLY